MAAEKDRTRYAVKGDMARAAAIAVVLAVPVVVGGAPGGENATVPEATRAAAQSFEAKLRILQAGDARPASSYSPIVITEHEANAYLKVHGRDFIPAGVREPGVRLEPEHVTGFATVNFDDFSRTYANPNDWGPKVMAAMFKGTQPVTATVKVQSAEGQAKVEIESVTVGSTKVPNWLVEFVLQNYLEPRYKFDLSKPIPLPEHVSQLVLGTGQAIFLRQGGRSR